MNEHQVCLLTNSLSMLYYEKRQAIWKLNSSNGGEWARRNIWGRIYASGQEESQSNQGYNYSLIGFTDRAPLTFSWNVWRLRKDPAPYTRMHRLFQNLMPLTEKTDRQSPPILCWGDLQSWNGWTEVRTYWDQHSTSSRKPCRRQSDQLGASAGDVGPTGSMPPHINTFNWLALAGS